MRIGEAATGIGDQMADVGQAVQRAKDKTEQLQARANAIDELTAAGALRTHLAGRRHRPPAAADLAVERGRRPAREDEGRDRPGLGAAEGARRRGRRQAGMTREVILAARPQGEPKESDFELRDAAAREPADGEVLSERLRLGRPIHAQPHDGIRTYVGPFEVGEVVDGGAVGARRRVAAPGFEAGDWVTSQLGWCESGSSTETRAQARPVTRAAVDRARRARHAGLHGLDRARRDRAGRGGRDDLHLGRRRRRRQHRCADRAPQGLAGDR